MEKTKFQASKWAKLGQNSVFGAIALMDVAKKNPDVKVVASDIGKLISADRFRKNYPENYIDVGIAEQNQIGIAGGLALEGNCVFAVTYAAFITMRSYEFVRHLLSFMKCNVKVIGMMSGLALGSGGVSHWSIEDIALMRSIPNIIVLSPADTGELYKMVQAVADIDTPVYIRLTGGENCPIIYNEDFDYQIGKAITLKEGNDVAIVATGLMVSDALEAAARLDEEGVSCTVVDMHTIKPLDEAVLEEIYKKHKLIVTVEEHNIIGGLGSAVAEHKARFTNTPKQVFMGITDEYKETGTRGYILNQYQLNPEGIINTIKNNL